MTKLVDVFKPERSRCAIMFPTDLEDGRIIDININGQMMQTWIYRSAWNDEPARWYLAVERQL